MVNQNKVLHIIYLICFLLGCFTFLDYGIGIEENFQQASGFYWLNFLLNFTNFEELKTLSELKFKELYSLNPNLPKVTDNLAYGIIFDLPVALIDVLLNNDKSYGTYIRHFLSFFIFFISSICFSLIIKKRFKNIYILYLGYFAYFFSPKIYGSIFFDGKDIIFLSLVTITIYMFQKFEYKKKYTNLTYFSIMAAICTSSRLPGVFIFISFIFFYSLKILNNYNLKNNLFYIFFFLVIYFIFLFLHWPYLWNFWEIDLDHSYQKMVISVFFDGSFYKLGNLPYSYIPKWILISTPIYILIGFIIGIIVITKRSYLRLINLKFNYTCRHKLDLWKGKNEGFDFYIFLSFIQIIFVYLTFTDEIWSSWRHYFFLHFFIIYFFTFGFYNIFLIFKNKLKILITVYFLLIVCCLEVLYKNYILHPYQNIYFNNLLSEKNKLRYERDTAHLSRIDALKKIILDSSNNNIKIGTASWTPLGDVKYMFSKNELNKITFLGNDDLEEADYIYTNYIYDVNMKYSNKYTIPDNFDLHYSLIKNKTLVYSIFKKK